MSSDRQTASGSPSPAARLRERLEAGRLTVPSCYDALGFRMIARAGFPAAFLSGFSVSAARLGVPDAGLLSYGEMAAQVRDVAAAARDPAAGRRRHRVRQRPERPAHGARIRGGRRRLSDAGGPGGAEARFRRARRVVSREDARRRVKAAVRAREAGADILIIGRTDARNAAGPASGLDEALWRAARLRRPRRRPRVRHWPARRAGARARARGRARCRRSSRWTSRSGTPIAPARVHALGFEVALYGITLVLAAAAAFRDALAAMAAGQSLPPERVGDLRRDRRHRRRARLPRGRARAGRRVS